MNEGKGKLVPANETRNITSNCGEVLSELEKARGYKNALETLLSVTNDYIYIKDAKHKFLFTSDAFARLTHHQSWRDLVGKDDFDIFPREHAEVYYQYEHDVIATGKSLVAHEEPYYALDGSLRWVSSTKNPVFDEEGQVIGLVGISKDITELKRQQEEINFLANHDHLTGLLNRRYFYESAPRLMAQARREKRTAFLLYIDLDDFKQTNDRFGHEYGDELLKKFAQVLQENSRESDLVARIGGDEFFMLIAPETKSVTAAEQLAKRIIQSCRDYAQPGSGCSIGIASSDSHHTLNDLVRAGDRAMYRAKQLGSDHFYVLEPAD